MKKYYNDIEYMNYVDDILEHDEFKKLGNIIHHEDNRLDHSIRVSYRSYKLAKLLRLDYTSVARAGLLHDFFFTDNESVTKKERLKTLFEHPIEACNNASKYFYLSELEKDIITTHMFPIGKKVPKYAESWLVDFVDDAVSIKEKGHVVFKQLSTAMSFILVLLINNL